MLSIVLNLEIINQNLDLIQIYKYFLLEFLLFIHQILVNILNFLNSYQINKIFYHLENDKEEEKLDQEQF